MARIKIVIDGNTIMNGDLGDWTTNPPELITDQLKANARPAPWMRAIMLTIADAAMTNQPTDVAVQTNTNGWTLTVEQTTVD